NDADWKRFLAATAVPSRTPLGNSINSVQTASLPPANTGGRSTSIAKSEPSKAVGVPHANTPLYKDEPSASIDTSAHPASRPARQGAAFSLGILIQTVLLTGQNRQEIIKTLKDIARNLRSDDEAFIMAFSNQFDFEQALTANTDLLEEALSTLKAGS